MPRTFWIHEDDIAQVQFMPSACRDFCIHQLQEIARHDIAHRDSDGLGWTAMYRIPSSPLPIAHLKIRPGDIAAAMPWRMRRVRRVMTGGWSGEGTPMERTAAYMSGRAAIVFSWNESKIVQSLWYRDAVLSRWHRRTMLEALFRLGILAPLLLVDWRGRILDLGDRKAIRSFLAGDETAAIEIPDAPSPRERAEPPPSRSDSLYRFDVPVRPVLLTRKFSEGPVCAVVAADDGDAWSIEIGPGALEDGPIGMPSPIRATGDRTISEWWDVANGRVLALCDYGGPEHAEVWDARDGATICTLRNPEAVVLCPDGIHLLNFDSDGIAIADLRNPEAPARQSSLFPFHTDENQASRRQGDVTLDNPSSVMAVARDLDGHDITLAIGDYGFAVVAGIRIGGEGEPPLTLTHNARVFSEGLVYDPVTIVDLVPGEWLIVRHGYGSGITRFDLRTGECTDCPLPADRPEPRYSAFRYTVPAPKGKGIWVETDCGPGFWDGSGPFRPLPGTTPNVLATDGSRYLAITSDGWDLVRSRFLPGSQTP